MGSMQNCSPGQLLSNKSRRRGLKHVRSNELHGKTADPEALTSWPVTKMLGQAKLMVQTMR